MVGWWHELGDAPLHRHKEPAQFRSHFSGKANEAELAFGYALIASHSTISQLNRRSAESSFQALTISHHSQSKVPFR